MAVLAGYTGVARGRPANALLAKFLPEAANLPIFPVLPFLGLSNTGGTTKKQLGILGVPCPHRRIPEKQKENDQTP